jgi:acetyltransferase-like isoleucine patch superfamily enzyme
MIIIIGLDMDLIDLIRVKFPNSQIGYIDIIDYGIDITYLGDDSQIQYLKDYSENRFIFGTDDYKVKTKILKTFNINTISIESNLSRVYQTELTSRGLIVQDFVYVSSSAIIGDYVKINVGAQIHHEVKIGDNSTIAPRACLLGKVKIGSQTYIGAGAIILPKIIVGDGCVISAGSVVTKNIDDGIKVKGIPAKIFK